MGPLHPSELTILLGRSTLEKSKFSINVPNCIMEFSANEKTNEMLQECRQETLVRCPGGGLGYKDGTESTGYICRHIRKINTCKKKKKNQHATGSCRVQKGLLLLFF